MMMVMMIVRCYSLHRYVLIIRFSPPFFKEITHDTSSLYSDWCLLRRRFGQILRPQKRQQPFAKENRILLLTVVASIGTYTDHLQRNARSVVVV
ncbi:hypothetical protein L1987_69722 [Smallanthus sonchifolius]|uniref:Uncharacterized protein n=1 Tax=Smallanthus sonchifolius TaxID=185202 RepID=A0ACB9B6L3_9ASTR|nr:hypothetical protein L1987_69722 [Smallanthus sonchifolius]